MAKVLDTSGLVASLKKRASIPTNQKLFSEAEFIEILNEQLNTYIMPFLMEQNEEFLVNFVDIPIEQDKTHYKIPTRAIGTKIREVVYRDTNGNFAELSQISVEELEEYQNLHDIENNGVFYFEGNNIVLLAGSTSSGSLRMYYYLQPNDLVLPEEGSVASAVYNPTLRISSRTNITGSYVTNPSFTAGAAEDIGASNQLTITGHGLGSGAKLRVSGNDLPTGLAINTDYFVIRVDADTIRLAASFADSVASPVVPITIAQDGSGEVSLLVETGVIVTSAAFPSTFTSSTEFDLISKDTPCSILNFDITPVNFDSTSKTLTFNVLDIDINAQAGDHLFISGDSPVAQIPLELQALLTQSAAVYCLEAMGDQEGLNSAMRKQQILETNLRGILNNRAEGSPKKVMSRHSTLRDTVRGKNFRKRF
jgi:hypothetical protein